MAAEFTRPASLYGAVDLGARKQALEAQARREAEEKSGRVPTVVEVTAATFSVDVVERSMSTPVVIEATVSRAEQVKQFSATLEKLAGESGGGWVLARVDVERDPQLAQALRMRVVPTVFLAFQGQILPLFEGPLPEAQVRQALQQVFQQLGVELNREGAPAQPAVDPDLAEGEAALAKGDLDTAEAAFTRLKEREPGNENAKIGLARVALMRRVRGLDAADVLRRAAADEADVALQCQAADVEMLNGQAEQAFDRLVGVVRRTKGEERDKARVHLLGLFEMFPVSDPLVLKARRALASALF